MKLVNKSIKKTTLQIKRYEGGYVDGVFVKQQTANLNILVHIQPFNGTNIESNTDAKWQKSILKIFSEAEILVKDEFDFQNKHYVVKSVANYAHSLIPHLESIAHEVEGENE